MSLRIFADHVENPANRSRIAEAARLLGASLASRIEGRLIAVENAHGATSVYGRSPLHGTATLVVGNEREGISRELLAEAIETVAIPAHSRAVNTLNVAAAAAVAGWYLLHGSAPEQRSTRPDDRRPGVLIVGRDHVEIGSSLRSAAAFGFRDIMLSDEGGRWADGTASERREARAAARAFKNPIRIHSATLDVARAFERVVVVAPTGPSRFLPRLRLSAGAQQIVVIGAHPDEVAQISSRPVDVASLRLEPLDVEVPLRFTASIALAEIARQVGRRRAPTVRLMRRPRYDLAVRLMPTGEVRTIEAATLLEF